MVIRMTSDDSVSKTPVQVRQQHKHKQQVHPPKQHQQQQKQAHKKQLPQPPRTNHRFLDDRSDLSTLSAEEWKQQKQQQQQQQEQQQQQQQQQKQQEQEQEQQQQQQRQKQQQQHRQKQHRQKLQRPVKEEGGDEENKRPKELQAKHKQLQRGRRVRFDETRNQHYNTKGYNLNELKAMRLWYKPKEIRAFTEDAQATVREIQLKRRTSTINTNTAATATLPSELSTSLSYFSSSNPTNACNEASSSSTVPVSSTSNKESTTTTNQTLSTSTLTSTLSSPQDIVQLPYLNHMESMYEICAQFEEEEDQFNRIVASDNFQGIKRKLAGLDFCERVGLEFRLLPVYKTGRTQRRKCLMAVVVPPHKSSSLPSSSSSSFTNRNNNNNKKQTNNDTSQQDKNNNNNSTTNSSTSSQDNPNSSSPTSSPILKKRREKEELEVYDPESLRQRCRVISRTGRLYARILAEIQMASSPSMLLLS